MYHRLAMSAAIIWSLATATSALADDPVQAIAQNDSLSSQAVTSPQSPAAKFATEQQFLVRCKLNRINSEGATVPLATPTIVVASGQEGQITVQGQRPFVTGLRTTPDDEIAPVVTVLNEGISGTFTVTALDDDDVLVDAAFDISSINQVDENPAASADGQVVQAPQVTTNGWRIVRSMQLGETTEILGKPGPGEQQGPVLATLTVDRLSADEAAITPIRTSDAELKSGDSVSQIVTNVYHVSDLLEPHSQLKEADALEDADFVPVIDMVLTEALVTWPETAEIRPYPKNGSLIISQTQASHEKIGQLLRDKRDNIAAVKKLMR